MMTTWKSAVGASCLALSVTFLAHHFLGLYRIKRQTKAPVNWRTLPLVGELLHLIDSSGRTNRWRDLSVGLGPVFGTLLLGKPTVYVNSPHVFEELYRRGARGRILNNWPQSMYRVFGKGALANIEVGDEHTEQRKLLMSLIGAHGMKKWFSLLSTEFAKSVRAIGDDGKFHDVFQQIDTLIFSVMSIALVGEPVSRPDFYEKLTEEYPGISKGFWGAEFSKEFKESMKARERLIKLYQEEFTARGEGDETRVDYIQALLALSKKNNTEPNIDAAIVNIWASLDTTKSFSLQLFDLMVEYPQVLEKVYQEVSDKFGDEGILHEDCTSFEALASLPYVCAVVQEVQRYAPLTGVFVRKAGTDIELEHPSVKGMRIPKDYTIVMNVRNILAEDERITNPEKFDPDRFYERKEDDSLSKLTFGHGPRLCPGNTLATFEMRALLVEMSRYVWERKEGSSDISTFEWVPLPVARERPFVCRAVKKRRG